MPEFLDVDPRILRLPSTRLQGADPGKLARQIARHGRSTQGMQPPWVYRGKAGLLLLYDGVTRATRIAKLLPGTVMRVEVIEDRPNEDYSRFPSIGSTLP